MLTTQQTTDLQTWLQDQTKVLPESLKNVLIEDCLEGLKNSGELRNLYNTHNIRDEWHQFMEMECRVYEDNIRFGSGFYLFRDLVPWRKKQVILVLLSQIDGKAVMEFLDVETKIINYADELYWDGGWGNGASKVIDVINKLEPKTLHHLLFREFTEALRIGKSFESALEIITKIYIIERYV